MKSVLCLILSILISLSLFPLNTSVAGEEDSSKILSSSDEADVIFSDYTHTQTISSAAISYYAANDTVGSNISLRHFFALI